MRAGRRCAVAAALLMCSLAPLGSGGGAAAGLSPEEDFHARNQRAIEHLQRGNALSVQGMHREAVEEWERAAAYRPDSNVPWNNMANSLTALKEPEAALRAARKAYDIHVDHMSATTLANNLRAKAQGSKLEAGELYEETERVLRAGMDVVRHSGERNEHPFWTLAMLLWDQGDYLEFLAVAKEGFDYLSREWCAPGDDAEDDPAGAAGACEVPDFELDIAEKIYAASTEVAHHAAGHGRFEDARLHLDWAQHVAQTYPSAKMDAAAPEFHAWCITCAEEEARTGRHACGRALDKCREKWRDTNGRYLRMMAVRVMGCEWRVRSEDNADFARMCASPRMSALLNHTLEFYFECDEGRVCGAGAQPPLHMFGTPMTLEAVLVMGKVQPLQLLDKMLSQELPAPEWAYPTWSPRVGASFKIAFVSSDLLRNHPVGNMMRHVLPLHDLSRMEVTLFIIHEQQRYQIQQVENHHILGEVQIKMLGRGPHVTQFWDATESVEAADHVNAAGICILFDLIGYTSDHRQDVLALRPAPIQVHYHGYMGTTGAPWIQGYVADRWIAPPEHAPFFSEKLMQMPECFLGPSHRMTHQFWGTGGSQDGEVGYEDGEIGEVGYGGEDEEEEAWEGGGGRGLYDGAFVALASRREKHGLPPHGPLLCFFNQHFKIDPETFGVWARASLTVDRVRRHVHALRSPSAPFYNTTIWMLRGSPVSQRNLRREMEAAGLSREQLVFAPRIKVKKHLRRASLCDIAVDTHEYNSGATAADTLFSGVPVLHLPGNKAVGRMLSAMLSAVRLPELIVRDFSEYQTLLEKLLLVSHGRHAQPFDQPTTGTHSQKVPL